jgi:hypothetical protein
MYEPANPDDRTRYYFDGENRPDEYASSLLTLMAESRREPPHLVRTDQQCQGSKTYYALLAREILSFAQADPEKSEHFLATVLLPIAEGQGLKRMHRLRNSLVST